MAPRIDFDAIEEIDLLRQTNPQLLNQAQEKLKTNAPPKTANELLMEYARPREFVPPENFRQGVGNLFNNLVMSPIQQALFIKERPAATSRRLADNVARLEYATKLQDLGRQETARELAGGTDLSNYPVRVQREYLVAQQSDPSKAFEVLSNYDNRFKTTNVQEYEYYKSTLAPGQTPISYQEFVQKSKATKGTTPSAVASFNFLKGINPSIDSLSPGEKQELFFKILRTDPNTAAKVAEAETKARQGGVLLTPAQSKVDELYAAEYNNYNSLGGYSGSLRDIETLDRLINILVDSTADGVSLTGPVVGNLPLEARPTMSVDLEDEVTRIIIRDLRKTLGAQFTQQEGENFVARSFNRRLPNEVNTKRLQRMRASMEQVHKQKNALAKYYEEKGTIAGANIRIPSISEMRANVFKASDYQGLTNDQLLNEMRNPKISNEEYDALEELAMERGL